MAHKPTPPTTVLLPVVAVFILVGVLRSPTTGAELLPIPTGDKLGKAEKTVQEVFGEELKAATTPKQKTELAQKMLETAAGSQPAEKYALLQKAKDLAIIAGDSTVGVRAVQDLVDTFAPENPQKATSSGTEGHRLCGIRPTGSGRQRSSGCNWRPPSATCARCRSLRGFSGRRSRSGCGGSAGDHS